MSGLKRIAVFFAVLAVLIALSEGGMYLDYSKVSDMELVRTVAIDMDGENVLLTASTGIGINGETSLISGAEAGSIAAAVNSLRRGAEEKEPYFSHVENLVIGEEAAKSGIDRYLDYIGRAMELRMDVNVFIVLGTTARDFILNAATDDSSASDMLLFLRKNIDMQTKGHVYTGGDIIARLAESGCALIQAVRLDPHEELGEFAEMIVEPAGLAVIKNGRMEDCLSVDSSAAACVMDGKASYEAVDVVTGEGVVVSLGVKDADVDIIPIFDGENLSRIEIKIDLSANIEQVCGTVSIESGALRQELKTRLEELARTRTEELINSAKELNADFLRIGQRAEMKHPYKLKEMYENWEDEFPTVETVVEVTAVIERSYDLLDPAETGGENKDGTG